VALGWDFCGLGLVLFAAGFIDGEEGLAHRTESDSAIHICGEMHTDGLPSGLASSATREMKNFRRRRCNARSSSRCYGPGGCSRRHYGHLVRLG
jgi:hypothetical protein